jgi:ketosteroid isomerase-like protein
VSAPTLTGRRAAQDTEGRTAAAAWVREFAEGWRAPTGPDAFADHFDRVLDPDIRLIQPQIPTLVGKDAFRHRFVRPLFTLIPDLRGEVERYAVGDNVAYIELTLRGTLGGRPIAWRVCDRVLLRDGLAIERESYMDPSPLLLAGLTRPRAWPRLLRARGTELFHRLKRRKGR